MHNYTTNDEWHVASPLPKGCSHRVSNFHTLWCTAPRTAFFSCQSPLGFRQVDPHALLVISAHANDNLCATWTQAHKVKQQQDQPQNHNGPLGRVQEATKLNAETRDPPSQDPRDHKEQPSRHNIHPDTLKQTPTTPGRNESKKNYRSETGE